MDINLFFTELTNSRNHLICQIFSDPIHCFISILDNGFNISDRIFSQSPGSCPGGGAWGYPGLGPFFPKFNQIWCVSYLDEWHMQRHTFWVPVPLGP